MFASAENTIFYVCEWCINENLVKISAKLSNLLYQNCKLITIKKTDGFAFFILQNKPFLLFIFLFRCKKTMRKKISLRNKLLFLNDIINSLFI